MKIAEIRSAIHAIGIVQKNPGGTSFKLAYALAKNHRHLTAAEALYRAALQGDFTDMIAAFETDRLAEITAICVKDAAGVPIQAGFVYDSAGQPVPGTGHFVLPDDLDQTALMADLKAKHPGIDDAFKAAALRMQQADAEDFEVDVYAAPMDIWPPSVDAAALDALLYLIDGVAAPAAAPASNVVDLPPAKRRARR